MKEWNNPINPFNSMKSLVYAKHLDACARGEYLPPVTVAIDPSNHCNYKCTWCNAKDLIGPGLMTPEHMREIVMFLSHWGAVSTCVAGGGEPLMNQGFSRLLEDAHQAGLKNSVITNGSLFDERSIKAVVKCCRWVGFSIDAGTARTYAVMKDVDPGMFDIVIENIRKVRAEIDRTGSACEIGFKYLVHPGNQREIVDAVILAKKAGAHDFQLRPVGTKAGTVLPFDIEMIDEQLKQAMLFEGPGFRVYGVRHKFNPDFSRKLNFSKCRALPMHPTFSADGNVHLCFDRRGDKKLILCRHDRGMDEVREAWGSEKHKKMMDDINLNECPKCTFSMYNEIIEKGFIEDRFCRDFI